jgi:hypothetical protein
MMIPGLRMRLRTICGGLAVSGLLLLVIGCLGGSDEEPGGPGDGFSVTFETPVPNNETTTPVVTPSPTATPSPTPTPFPVCGSNPDPAPPEVLQVQTPEVEAEVQIPFQVQGWGSTIGKDDVGVAVAIVNDKLQVVDVLDVPPQPRAYRLEPSGLDVNDDTRPFGADVVIVNVTEPTRFCVWVYLETDADGLPKQVVQVPITVSP